MGQGALALEIRRDDRATAKIVAALDHGESMACIAAERGFLRRLGGGCLAPATAHATIRNDRLSLQALVGEIDGRALLMEQEIGAVEDGPIIGARLAERLLSAGAGRVLARARAAAAAGA